MEEPSPGPVVSAQWNSAKSRLAATYDRPEASAIGDPSDAVVADVELLLLDVRERALENLVIRVPPVYYFATAYLSFLHKYNVLTYRLLHPFQCSVAVFIE